MNHSNPCKKNSFLQFVGTHLSVGHSVLIHCMAGAHRFVFFLWLIFIFGFLNISHRFSFIAYEWIPQSWNSSSDCPGIPEGRNTCGGNGGGTFTLLKCIGFALCNTKFVSYWSNLFFCGTWFALCILLVEPHSQNLFAVLGFTFSITLCIVLVCITLLAEPHTASVHSIVPS